ncbi:hypothetical protein EDB81DRAFT_892011 [Dactylonectria macrodidyma]|uniref:Zn(2)-C6 fungal-type domain-containing protein n=2 Tax=Dactylonectria TaxID=1620264 RepID=A0A9P9DGC6_9HYPO|nr:hypothetical protein B0J13DRAFT_534271 [Dactylonectria estremocensis]KAH7118409.1 hypothetical protein EDB81DRAFT_892011 [Dactylonectria macrodidyma]
MVRRRTGCSYCKVKKKKCDEIQPSCARCQERGQECVYEPVRPRQRRKHEPTAAYSPSDTNSSSGSDRVTQPWDANVPIRQWKEDAQEKSADEDSLDEAPVPTRAPVSNAIPIKRSLANPMDHGERLPKLGAS